MTEDHARLRDTLLVFLQTGGSYKATAEQLTLHKNTIQYRIRKAEESLGQAGQREPGRPGTSPAGQPLARPVCPAAAAADRGQRAGARASRR